jgi:hypothetical protein
MPIDPLKIARAIRAAEAAKKKVAKIPAGQARFVAKEEMKNIGKRPGRKVPKTTGLSRNEKSILEKRLSVEKRERGRSVKPKDVIFGRVIAKEEMRKKLAASPAKKGTSKRAPVQLTRGKSIAKRSEVEEVMAKRMTKEQRRNKLESMLKKMDPADRKRIEARVQIKRAQRDENAGLTKFGMDVKPRKQLDDKVVERAKELTAQERNEIARKQAMEFGQRRESDRRIQEALKEIARREKMQRGKR